MSASSSPIHMNESCISWTGKAPIYGICPGVDKNGFIRSLPQVSLNATRQQLRDYFDNSWTVTEVMFDGLTNNGAFYQQPYHKLRHPMIFYYAHPAVFYINKLRVAGLLEQPVDPKFEQLFETGVDEMRWDHLHEDDQHMWPSVSDVRQYRVEVYRIVCELIETHSIFDQSEMPITMDKPSWALVMGFEHERIHFETSTVLIRELPIEFVRPPASWPTLLVEQKDRNSIENPMIQLDESIVKIGKPTNWLSFGWDNEYGSESRTVRSFSACTTLISNTEFYDFVVAGGYVQERYWSHDGWSWRSFSNIKAPTFWVQMGPAGLHQYKLRTTFEIIEMQWDWPVCINYYEAKAYCAWRTKEENSAIPYRLQTEAEHHMLRDGKEHPWNNNLRNGSEVGVRQSAVNEKGFYDVFGNLWQWCEDHFHPLKGSVPHPYYNDFSVPCYDGEHQIILGGSFVSTGDEASVWARFHFRPHFLQHAGFRLVRSNNKSFDCDAQRIQKDLTYETEEMLNRYLMMHWGEENERFDSSIATEVAFPQVVELPIACAQLVQRFSTSTDRALDLGCAVGRSAFELARDFKEVVGIDYSRHFIEVARHLQQFGTLKYVRKDQGMQTTPLVASVDPSIDRLRVRFEVGDACALPLILEQFDAVILANVICRLPNPATCLERMQGVNGLVKPGGILVMTSPFSWFPQYTPPANWLNTVDDIAAILSDFELLHRQNLPFLIREHRRKYEYIITLATVWKRRLPSE